ncbi:patatin-like phospholipase domain protein [Parasponia andersonii]|uniref:Patatin-like phospholipase domain protein n=1 Tax=Parasponia andersonii TaxID=3476 RepID=A0A2P5AW01_PARAD|nr:patatin-like phospholipase domain protein [Parasponia andersonii]
MVAPGLKPQQEHPFLFHEGIGPRSDDRYDSWQRMNHVSHGDEYTSSGVCSPPLWKNSSPPRSPNQQRAHYRSLSPASRAQAIARGQRELMEMVRNMPESCYELSLKDLVERPAVDQAQAQQARARQEEKDGMDTVMRNGSQKKRNDFGNRGKEMRRSGTMENDGLLLKMVFPVSFGSKKKNKSVMMMKKNEQSILANASSKVSPKPLVSYGSKGNGGNTNSSSSGGGADADAGGGGGASVDKEWWRKGSSASGESESGDQSSLNSGSMKSSSGSTSSSRSSIRSNSTR